MPEYLHLDFRPRNAGWIAQLQTRARNSSSQKVRARYETWAESGLGQLALSLATKLEVRDRVARRFRDLMQTLLAEVDGAEDLGYLLEGGYVFTPGDSGILYDTCAAVDSVIFESRSAYEMTGKFVTRFCEVILNRRVTQEDLIRVLTDAGQDVAWIQELRDSRILFFHNTAPWIALEIHARDPLQFQLVVMKENLENFDDRSKFITQEDLANVWDGYERSMSALKSWLEDQIDAAGTS